MFAERRAWHHRQHRRPPRPVESSPTGGGRDKLYHYAMLIQTDAKLNLGTSGGPLLSLKRRNGCPDDVRSPRSAVTNKRRYALPSTKVSAVSSTRSKKGARSSMGSSASARESERRGAQDDPRRDSRARCRQRHAGAALRDASRRHRHARRWDADSRPGRARAQGRAVPVDAKLPVKFLRNRQTLELSIELTKFPIRGEKIVTDPASVWRGLRIDYATTRPEIWNARRA